MAYGRQSIRKAGEFLYGFEKDYAEAIQRLIMGDDYHNIPRSVLAGLAGNPIGSSYRTIKADSALEKALGIGAVGLVDASNLGIRYGIPLAAGSAIGNSIVGLMQPQDPGPGQLPLS